MIDFNSDPRRAATLLAASMLLLANRDKATDTAISFAIAHKQAAVEFLTEKGYMLTQMQEVDVNRDSLDFLGALDPVKDLKIPHSDDKKSLFVTREELTSTCLKLYGV